MKYLREPRPGVFVFDHCVTPEARAMFCAMVSRLPSGGIAQRYKEVVDAAGEECGEDVLTQYPLHPRVQRFFDEFVGKYGHSSILELTGSPAIVVEGVSWLTAWLLFDSPLVAGQEFSTRAVRFKDWPMAREAEGNPVLEALHRDWLEVFEAEVAWWTEHLSDPANRQALGIGDKEPFRPALDRARWALPGTIATGAAFACHMRDRARTLRDAATVAPHPLWDDIAAAYRDAVPGIAAYGLRESVHGESNTPAHLDFLLTHPGSGELSLSIVEVWTDFIAHRRKRKNSYADPIFNAVVRVTVNIPCSLAVARDWHRHRTLYPWSMSIVAHPTTGIGIHSAYEPKSALGKERTPELLRRSHEASENASGLFNSALCYPLGTEVAVSASGGLRDVLYMLELRGNTHGANFEYKEQALKLLDWLVDVLGESLRNDVGCLDR